jgi:hypothetical protein
MVRQLPVRKTVWTHRATVEAREIFLDVSKSLQFFHPNDVIDLSKNIYHS